MSKKAEQKKECIPIKDHIVQVDLHNHYMESMTKYSLAIWFDRYVPNIFDGLTPIRRRILYCMFNDIKCWSKSSKTKSAKSVGAVIGSYSAHGDACLRYNTLVYLTSGQIISIGELYDSGIRSFESLGINLVSMQPEPIIAHSLRIGQTTKQIYHIQLSNGVIIDCTWNHPFMMKDGTYKQAKDLVANDILFTAKYYTKYTNERPALSYNSQIQLIQDIVWNYYNGHIPFGFVKHHIDHNPYNNLRSNLIMLSKGDHAKLHNDYSEGLIAGRVSMADPNSLAHTRNWLKNQKLRRIYNNDSSFRRFKNIINKMIADGMDVTYENYESLRGSVFCPPKVSKLIAKGYGDTFEDLVNYDIPSIGELYDAEMEHHPKLYTVLPVRSNDASVINHKYGVAFDKFQQLIQSKSDITLKTFNRLYQRPISMDEFVDSYNQFINICPFVTNVWVEELTTEEPMFDFTVDTTNNMLFPAIGMFNSPEEFPMICLHNSTYGAFKPMTNWFEIKVPLLCYDSASGSIQGGPQAQMRYTESYLSPFTMEAIMADLQESRSVVDWDKTFDRKTDEPVYLPVKVPLLLVNGTYGIAIGERIEVPPHSLNDVVDATLTLLHNPDAKITLIPDPCDKCELVNADWKKIASTGVGTFVERGITEVVTDSKGNTYVSIRSTPDLVWVNDIVDNIEKLVKANKLIQIADIQDHSTKDSLDVRLYLKKGSDPEYVRQVLYKSTALQDTKKVNMRVIMNDEIVRVGYKAYLLTFIEFRRMVKFRLYNARLQKDETRLHTIEVFIAILESGDVEGIVQAIRNQTASEEQQLVEWLMKKLKITPVQARYILNTEIKRLSKSNLSRYKQEQKELENHIKQYIKVITTPQMIDDEIEQEMLAIRTKYGKPRQSIIINASDANNIPQGTFKVVVYDNGTIKKLQPNDLVKAFKGVQPKSVCIGENDRDILLFDEMGKVFRLPIHKIALTDKNGPGLDIRLILKKLTSNLVACMYLPEIETLNKSKSKFYLISITHGGLIKRMGLDDILNTTPSGIIYSKLNQGDFIKEVTLANHDNDIVIYTKSKAVRLSMNAIPYLKRSTLGNIGMRTNDAIDGIAVITKATKDLVIVTNKGYINRIRPEALPCNDKNKTGSKVIKLSKNDSIVAIFTCMDDSVIRCYHTDGSFTDLETKAIELGSSVSGGVKLVKETVKAQIVKL